MKYKFLILIAFLFVNSFSFAQDKKSKGDDFFFEYKYPQAIIEYKKEKNEHPLSKRQLLNLTDSYLHTENYKNAFDAYLEIYREDNEISTYQYNNGSHEIILKFYVGTGAGTKKEKNENLKGKPKQIDSPRFF